MGKPNNFDDLNCQATSSNCVIYDGRDLPCLKMCKGDSVTQVVYDLGTQLCTILDQLDISEYSLSCLVPFGGKPTDFKSFINLLIAKVCNDAAPPPSPGGSGQNIQSISECPNCNVNLAPAFQYTDPSTGDIVTKDLVQNYVQKIGLRVGNIINEIAFNQKSVASVSERVNVLENTRIPVFKLPELYPKGIADPNTLIPLDQFVSDLESQFVSFRKAVGDETDIYNAITTPPSDFNLAKALGTSGGVMGSLPSWVTDPKSLTDSLINLWLTVEDSRSAIRNIQLNILTACESIQISLAATLENKILKLFFTGTIPTNLTNCVEGGSLFKISDNSGNFFNTRVDIKNNINNISGIVVDLNSTSLNFADDLIVESSVVCFTDLNTSTTCSSYLHAIVNNNFNCPTLNVIPSTNAVAFSFTHTEGILTYSVQLFDNTNNLIQSQNYSVSGAINISGEFSSLIANSLYRIRLQMITSSNTKTCPLIPFNTLPNPCPAPNTVISILEY